LVLSDFIQNCRLHSAPVRALKEHVMFVVGVHRIIVHVSDCA